MQEYQKQQPPLGEEEEYKYSPPTKLAVGGRGTLVRPVWDELVLSPLHSHLHFTIEMTWLRIGLMGLLALSLALKAISHKVF